MKSSENMAERMTLAQLLLRAGPEARAVLGAEVLTVFAPSEALKLVDLLRLALTEEEAEEALAATLRHPALAVRRRAAAYLKGRPTPRTAGHFMEALRKENDPSVRVLFVETLGALNADSAFTTLGQVLDSRGETDEVRGAAARALGALGKPQAIAMLARVANKGRGFALVLNPAPTAVRAAALRALGAFTRYPEAREALRRGLEDTEAAVREAAREALLSPFPKTFGEMAARVEFVGSAEALDQIGPGAFAAYLSEVPLDAVCHTLEERGRSGLLQVHVGGSNAQISLDRGSVVNTDYNNLKGQEAFNQFCRWEGVYVLFTPGAGAGASGPPQSLIKMLMDACELRERANRGA
jgi:hypothetical protein